jgi:hypothetical protein
MMILVFVSVFVIVAVVVFFALGGFKGPSTIKFEIVSSHECTYTFTYMDGNGLHQSQETVTGSYWVSVRGASSANFIVFSDYSLTAYAYVNGNLVDQQSGTYVMLSANA